MSRLVGVFKYFLTSVVNLVEFTASPNVWHKSLANPKTFGSVGQGTSDTLTMVFSGWRFILAAFTPARLQHLQRERG